MTIKTCKTAVRASAILVAFALSGGAFADGILESFEGKTVGDTLTTSTITGLTGNGTYAAGGAETAPAVGYPITSASGHSTALAIAGTVTYTESGTPSTGASQVDFMFKVEPTDELEDPAGDDVKVALAVGTNAANTTTAPIKLWCKPSSSGAAQWVELNSAVETGSWMRATLVLDYTGHKCSVSLNGDPALNNGDKWFYFANNGETAYVQSITMVGSTMVDDLVVTHTALANYEIPGGGTAVANAGGVTYDYINKYGVTVAQAQSSTPLNAESGMSVADKFEAGLDPKSATKFEMQTMATTKDSATVTFPGTKGTGQYTVKVGTTKGGSDVATQTSTQIDASGEGMNSATITIPAAHQDELLYFTVETVAQ